MAFIFYLNQLKAQSSLIIFCFGSNHFPPSFTRCEEKKKRNSGLAVSQQTEMLNYVFGVFLATM